MLYQLPSEAKALRQTDYSDTHWRSLILDANTAFTDGDYDRARALYDDALGEARVLFAAAYDTEVKAPVAVLLVIACHNRADFANTEGDHSSVRKFATEAYELLVAAAEDPMAPLALRKSAIQNLSKAIAYLAELARTDTAAQPTLREAITRVRRSMAVFRVAEHARYAEATCDHCGLFQ